MTTERREGWYWVRPFEADEWECCEISPAGVWLGHEPFEVGPRIPAPGEGWRCVPGDQLRKLRDSISGDCCMGEEWERATIDAMLAAPPTT